jgi:hypothetical protein
MNRHSRRSFLRNSVGALAAIGAPAGLESQARRSKTPLNKDVLQALAEIMLPQAELKAEGVARVTGEFEKWLDGFEPAAEQDHPYLSSSDIVYGPADPRGRWQSQLEALDLEAQKEIGKPFRNLSTTERRRLIERTIRSERLDRLPAPAGAAHVSIALAAFFYATSEANDQCYEATIGRWLCRGLDSGPQKPSTLAGRS